MFTYKVMNNPKSEQKELIISLNNSTQTGNQNTNNKKWNTLNNTNVYISKIKLN